MKLSDGSTICYDRGSQYGDYAIEGGDLVKKDGGSDWRYIVCEEYDLNHYEPGLGTGGIEEVYSGKPWGIENQNDPNAKGKAIGTGKNNTDYLIDIYNSDAYLWYYVNQHRINTGKNWFVPSKDELNILHENKTMIGNFTLNLASYKSYWSSSNYVSGLVWTQSIDSGDQSGFEKNFTYVRVRCIRYV